MSDRHEGVNREVEAAGSGSIRGLPFAVRKLLLTDEQRKVIEAEFATLRSTIESLTERAEKGAECPYNNGSMCICENCQYKAALRAERERDAAIVEAAKAVVTYYQSLMFAPNTSTAAIPKFMLDGLAKAAALAARGGDAT